MTNNQKDKKQKTKPEVQSQESEVQTMRHSLSHILAAAVLDMFPEAKLGMGPAIENGFYYDFDLPRTLIPEDLPILEEKMRRLIKEDLKFEKSEVPIEKALEAAKGNGQLLKEEILSDLKNQGEVSVSFYKINNFTDLCKGPHVESTEKIGAFKLNKISGAYWKGDEKRRMLQRIYGLAFETQKELDEYLKMMEEAEKRDHRKLAEQLDLFMISEEVGKGLPIWLPKGAYVRKKLEDYMYQAEKEAGFDFIYTPILAHEKLYKTSGHLSHYKEDMYSPIDIEGEKYYLKPMNCPHHHIAYSRGSKSYRDLPVRYADFSPIHRFERSGVLTGLIRARTFSQNDAHIYAKEDQIKDELKATLSMFKKVYDDFGIEGYWFRLSLPDFSNEEKFGDIENKKLWEKSAEYARDALNEMKVKFEEATGEAAFYGPKIDVQTKNVMGKEDTIATMQIDFYMPEKFDLTFINEQGEKERPVVIHRAIMGSFDRFFAFLVEKTGGAFPLWLSPVQAVILPISDEKHLDYANKVAEELIKSGIQVEVDSRSESLGKRIRDNKLQKVPFILVVGDKEKEDGTVAVNERNEEKQEVLKIDKFIEKILKEITEKK